VTARTDARTERTDRPLDLRLAVGAGAAWLSLVVCLSWSPAACVATAVASCTAGLLALVVRRRWAQPIAL